MIACVAISMVAQAACTPYILAASISNYPSINRMALASAWVVARSSEILPSVLLTVARVRRSRSLAGTTWCVATVALFATALALASLSLFVGPPINWKRSQPLFLIVESLRYLTVLGFFIGALDLIPIDRKLIRATGVIGSCLSCVAAVGILILLALLPTSVMGSNVWLLVGFWLVGAAAIWMRLAFCVSAYFSNNLSCLPASERSR